MQSKSLIYNSFSSVYSHIIVGAGFSGAVVARILAEEIENAKILVIDRRDHIAGNMFDFVNENGIRVQKYGMHIMHTNNKAVVDFINRFSRFLPFKSSAWVDFDDGSPLIHSPFNFTAIDAFYKNTEAENLKELLVKAFPNRSKVSLFELMNAKEEEIRQFVETLFEKDVRPYTAKQWGVSAEEIDKSVLERVPMFLSYQQIFDDEDFCGVPENGFVSLFENLLDHPKIDVQLKTDALKYLSFHRTDQFLNEAPVLFSGEIDELFNYQEGKLGYRTLNFEYENRELEVGERFAQKGEGVIHPFAKSWTRQMEYKYLYPNNRSNPENVTTLCREFPKEAVREKGVGDEPYYPLFTAENIKKHSIYQKESANFKNLFLAGRLADFKYYDMDKAIERAFEVAAAITKYQPCL